MRTLNRQMLTFLVGTLSVVSFLILSSFAVVWANGLKFNSDTGTFEKTVLIAIDSNFAEQDVYINGKLVSSSVPYRARNLLPGNFRVDIKKDGFRTWSQNFRLSEGQVGIIDSPTLLAVEPLISISETDIKSKLLDSLDFGLMLQLGELTDRGVLVTRFAESPLQIHRFNTLYLYQVGNELRLFNAAGSQDDLIYTAERDGQIPLSLFPNTWQIGVAEINQSKLINLTIPTSKD